MSNVASHGDPQLTAASGIEGEEHSVERKRVVAATVPFIGSTALAAAARLMQLQPRHDLLMIKITEPYADQPQPSTCSKRRAA